MHFVRFGAYRLHRRWASELPTLFDMDGMDHVKVFACRDILVRIAHIDPRGVIQIVAIGRQTRADIRRFAVGTLKQLAGLPIPLLVRLGTIETRPARSVRNVIESANLAIMGSKKIRIVFVLLSVDAAKIGWHQARPTTYRLRLAQRDRNTGPDHNNSENAIHCARLLSGKDHLRERLHPFNAERPRH